MSAGRLFTAATQKADHQKWSAGGVGNHVSLQIVFVRFVLIKTIKVLLVSQSMIFNIQNKISTIKNNTIHSDVHYLTCMIGVPRKY